MNLSGNGAFSTSFTGGTGATGAGWRGGVDIFNASLSNPIYGNSETVQPSSLILNYIIKY